MSYCSVNYDSLRDMDVLSPYLSKNNPLAISLESNDAYLGGTCLSIDYKYLDLCYNQIYPKELLKTNKKTDNLRKDRDGK